MPTYDASHFDPPAPVASATLRNPHSRATVPDVQLLLDTGADVTLLPRIAVERLGVPLLANEHYELMGFDGSKSFARVVMLDVLFLRRAFRGRVSVDRGRARHFGSVHSQPCDGAIGWSAAAMVGTYAVAYGSGRAPNTYEVPRCQETDFPGERIFCVVSAFQDRGRQRLGDVS